MPEKIASPIERFPYATIILIVINFVVFIGPQQQGRNEPLTMEYSFVAREIATGHNLIGAPDGSIREVTGRYLTDKAASPIHWSPGAEYSFPGLRTAGPMWTLLTAMFLHASWPHLLGNMTFLFCFGPPLEIKIGRLKFLALYLAAGLFAGLCTALYTWATLGLLHSAAFAHNLGASGAIAGVIGCFLALRPKGEMRIPDIEGPFVFPTFEKVPTWMGWVFAAFFVITQYGLYKALMSKLDKNPFADGVGYITHLFGFAGGALIAALEVSVSAIAILYIFPVVWPAIQGTLAKRWGL